ncbi:hypothetical protein STCU_01493 [Strigomonas culicis]|uniref:Uncharacterized protein n=1 Tax=Strigomonas culicis TaxID=28005 RepID=S9V0V0_9TRYP|nr:hypothetical protein STCU_06604 [Strigomonas culicis]EPY29519.1 hypothetical protein STCU_04502 [Strigomonas culicis]EPY34609.1 hypothetical protein STCU_01493 [Strigomonas culicis]|eukprot:EPY25639.1 hypothetical protein STCU_06604 [Strigomonas culicis]
MKCSRVHCRTDSGLFRSSGFLLKRSGKPGDLPAYKQVYLPYDTAPTKMELDRERRKFARAYHGRQEHKKMVEIKDVPENMYTYGKEGMSVPISLFKEQADPVIGPEWTYPGIYENKIAAQQWYTEELFDRETKDAFESPWQRQILDNQVKAKLGRVAWRMSMLNIKTVDLFHKERGSSRRTGGAGTGAEEPAKAGKK